MFLLGGSPQSWGLIFPNRLCLLHTRTGVGKHRLFLEQQTSYLQFGLKLPGFSSGQNLDMTGYLERAKGRGDWEKRKMDQTVSCHGNERTVAILEVRTHTRTHTHTHACTALPWQQWIEPSMHIFLRAKRHLGAESRSDSLLRRPEKRT